MLTAAWLTLGNFVWILPVLQDHMQICLLSAWTHPLSYGARWALSCRQGELRPGRDASAWHCSLPAFRLSRRREGPSVFKTRRHDSLDLYTSAESVSAVTFVCKKLSRKNMLNPSSRKQLPNASSLRSSEALALACAAKTHGRLHHSHHRRPASPALCLEQRPFGP